MNKNIRFIDVNGITGLILFMFILMCLAAGFIIFPGFLLMTIWNYISEISYMTPAINFLQGELLWAIIVIAFCIVTKNRIVVSMVSRNTKKN